MMNEYSFSNIDEKYFVFWAVPTSGMGHVSDEQPLPLIKEINGAFLTPNFGGEQGWEGAGWDVLPLPFGKLAQGWPLNQRLFNFGRRKVNIYWRNLFKTRSRKDRVFYFADQLNYNRTSGGYTGECPILKFCRNIKIKSTKVDIEDEVSFKQAVKFEEFIPVNLPVFQNTNLIKSEEEINTQTLNIISNSNLVQDGKLHSPLGKGSVYREKMSNLNVTAGTVLKRSYTYYFPGT